MDVEQFDTKALRIVQEEKLRELQAQQKNVKELQSQLGRINSKLKNKEKLSEEDLKFVGELGWLSALAAVIATLATSI